MSAQCILFSFPWGLYICAYTAYFVQPVLWILLSDVALDDEMYPVSPETLFHENTDVVRRIISGVETNQERLVRNLAGKF